MPRRRRLRRPGALSELPPLRIVTQIAALQGIYYASALLLTLFTALAAGTRFGVDLVLGWEAVRGDTTQGWLAAFVGVLEGFCLGGAIVMLVTRSKLVPDFALTTHFIHLVVCTFYTGMLPRNAMWWGSMAASSAVAVGLGVWGCQYRELQPISFGGSRRDVETGAGDAEGALGSQDEEGGLGRGRGRGRDGAGEYEMVRMAEDPRTK
ncbi:related to multi copy suppressor SYS1 [Cephalotrichum gorgonifer]|uniref:Related to multi copy suppressor SYS1 n=1 Tax=Cephalotrichum gorgonifer TaxID=2041049 RepID=A0AAE8T051_9PEZI|nr:related to multi copy suppressor SYS1 [Cephalotrichum gorgonifer]